VTQAIGPDWTVCEREGAIHFAYPIVILLAEKNRDWLRPSACSARASPHVKGCTRGAG
jgi:hypothetical protein